MAIENGDSKTVEMGWSIGASFGPHGRRPRALGDDFYSEFEGNRWLAIEGGENEI